MEDMQQNVAPAASVPPVAEMPPHEEPEEAHKSIGLVGGIVVVLLTLILGALYLWGSTLIQQEVPVEDVTLVPPPATAPQTETLSTSTEIPDIEKDLDGELSSLDEDFRSLDAALDSEL